MPGHWDERLAPGRAASHMTVQIRWEPRAERARMRCRSRKRKILLPLVQSRVSNVLLATDNRGAHAAAVGRGTRRGEGRHREPAEPRRSLVRLHVHPDSLCSTYRSVGGVWMTYVTRRPDLAHLEEWTGRLFLELRNPAQGVRWAGWWGEGMDGATEARVETAARCFGGRS